ncbi:MAG: class II fructose-bisphosphate aldolase [Erysipelothrix sp.]|nr:class II fructose-bisphosphate aldolase [Erysipelothrix sp.]
MLVNLKEIFRYANKHNIAVGAFNVPTLQMLKAVLISAEKKNMPVIIQHTEGHNNYISMEEVLTISKYYADKSSVMVCVHLDHGLSFESCKKAIDLGFTSVMFDGSMLDYEANVDISKSVVDYASRFDVTVEAELGFMLNSDIGAGEGLFVGDAKYAYTNPNQALDFVKRTGVDCLAIAAGTVHGLYLTEPNLNLEVIKEISNLVKIPLVLHGGSGLKRQEYTQAIQNGIRKINYYTYMNKAGGDAIKSYFNQSDDYLFFDELSLVAQEAMIENVSDFMDILNMERDNYENSSL